MSPESSTSSDRSSPLSASSTSFCNIISTPVASSKVKKRTQRKKSINYRATVVSKILFYGKEKKNVRDKNKKKNVVQKKKSCGTDRFCSICTENTISDMRKCEICQTWFHKECVGITKDDDGFLCPDCDQ